jgi:hypothetical protein
MEVAYFSDDDDTDEFQYPVVTLNWSNNGFSTSLTIDDIYSYDIEEIKNFRDCMINGEKSCSIGGGGNSNWSMSCKNKILTLDFIISGSGQGSTFITQIPCHLLLDQFNHLVDLMEHIKRKEKYNGAIDLSIKSQNMCI